VVPGLGKRLGRRRFERVLPGQEAPQEVAIEQVLFDRREEVRDRMAVLGADLKPAQEAHDATPGFRVLPAAVLGQPLVPFLGRTASHWGSGRVWTEGDVGSASSAPWSRCRSREYRNAVSCLCTAIERAFRLPTSATNLLPRVTPVYNKFLCSMT